MTDYTIFGTAALAANAQSPFANTRGTNGEIDSHEFYVTSPAWLTAIRFYRQTTAIAGTITGAVSSVTTATTGPLVTGTTVNFDALSGTGWQTKTLSAPVQLTVNQRYRVRIQWGTNRFAGNDPNYWTSGAGRNGFVSGPLVAPGAADAVGGFTARGVISSSISANMTVALDYNYSCDVVVTDADPTDPDPTGQLSTMFLPYM